jgi:hypothetical protein
MEDRLERIENAVLLLANMVEEGEWTSVSEQVGDVLFGEFDEETHI